MRSRPAAAAVIVVAGNAGGRWGVGEVEVGAVRGGGDAVFVDTCLFFCYYQW